MAWPFFGLRHLLSPIAFALRVDLLQIAILSHDIDARGDLGDGLLGDLTELG